MHSASKKSRSAHIPPVWTHIKIPPSNHTILHHRQLEQRIFCLYMRDESNEMDPIGGKQERTVGSRVQGDDIACRYPWHMAVSYTHLRAHETVLDLVCRL